MIDAIAGLAYTALQWVLAILICALMILRVDLFLKLVVYSALAFCVLAAVGIAAAPLMLVISPLLLPVVIVLVAVVPLIMVFSD